MTREPSLDDRTVDWLREGPERAPDWVLASADAHARAHPRRGFRARLRGRFLPGPMRLVRAEEKTGERHVSRSWAGRVSIAAILLVVVGFAMGTQWDRGFPPAAGPSGLPSLEALSAVPVTLSATCPVATNAVDTQSGGITRTRGGRLRCDTASADPRPAGTADIFLSIDRRPDGTTASPAANADEALMADLDAIWGGTADAAKVAAVYAPDAVFHDTLEGKTYIGLEAIQAKVAANASAGFRCAQTSASIRQDSFVAVFHRFSAGGVTYPVLAVFELKDGEVINQWAYPAP